MKTKSNPQKETPNSGPAIAKTIPFGRAKEIVREEEIDYTDEELKEVLQFVSKVVSITTGHYERTRQEETRVIDINANTNTTHETKSLPLHPRKYRRAS